VNDATWMPNEDILDMAHRDAERRLPHEACGLVHAGRYYPLKNISPTPEDAFLIADADYVRFTKEIGVPEAVVHSHVFQPPIASEIDRVSCEQSGLPWLIVSTPSKTHSVIRPVGFRAPLVGRTWAWGVHDCFGVIRDGLSDYTGIVLPNVERQWEFWHSDFDFIRSKMEMMGLVELPAGTPLQHCDILGMRVHGKVVNHLGLYLAPDKLLHQMSMRLSMLEVYGGTYQRLTELHMRHESLLDVEVAA
jgi:proteasome lid subunit RPN8/RPN11